MLSPGEEQSNAPKYCYVISLQEVAELAEMLNEFAPGNELENEVVFVRNLNHAKHLT